jgi:hypothetical protein
MDDVPEDVVGEPQEKLVQIKEEDLKTLVEALNELNELKQDSGKSDWDKAVGSVQDSPILLSDPEHKAFLVNPVRSNSLDNMADILDKDFSLSMIDRRQADVYGIQIECIEEWKELGFVHLATRRWVHLKGKMGINRSIAGIERFLQTANASATTEMQLANNQIKPEELAEKKSGFNMAGMKNWFK